ncbi:sigma factor-like helix-turn-helix DNA-binding protein, partial [Acinetobacter baumannii]
IVPADQHERLAAREVLARLGDLPDDQRAALMLVAVEGLSYEEVAAVQGVPVGTVMSRLSRARARLRSDSGEPPGLRRVK